MSNAANFTCEDIIKLSANGLMFLLCTYTVLKWECVAIMFEVAEMFVFTLVIISHT